MREPGRAHTGIGRPLPGRLLIAALVVAVIALGAGAAMLWQYTQTVVTVNGYRITRGELYRAMYARVGQQTLDELITRRLVMQAARDAKVTVDETEVQEYMRELIDRFGGEDAFAGALAYYGVTREAVEEDVRVSLLAEKTVTAGVEFTEEELQIFFDNNRELFATPEMVRASHIVLATEEAAQDVLRRLGAGEDFAALAAELSTDISTAQNGGDLGFFSRGQMLEEVEEAAFALEVGGLSGPVSTLYGYHVVLVTDRQPAREPAFAEVRDEVLRRLRKLRADEHVHDWMQMLRMNAVIRYRTSDGK